MRTAAVGKKSNVTILTRPSDYGIPEQDLLTRQAKRLTDKQAIASQQQLGGYRHGLPIWRMDPIIALIETAPVRGGTK